MSEDKNYKLDHTLKVKTEDLVDQIHERDVDLVSNHIYLFGREEYHNEDQSEPGVEYMMANRFIRNLNLCMRVNPDTPIVIHMKTCFSGKTIVTTDNGIKKIKDIKIGDMVLTHKGRYRPVIDTSSQMYEGEMTRIYYARNKHNSNALQGTSDHAVYIERGDIKMWMPLKHIVEGDKVFVETKNCEVSGEKIPFFRRIKNYDCDRLVRKNSNLSRHHLEKDILPFCDKLESEGWTVIPVGGNVSPDIIAIKDGKIVAFEVEKLTGKSLEIKKLKYRDAHINKYIDEVVWAHPTKENPEEKFHTEYEIEKETGFAKVLVTGTKKWKNKIKQKVFDITVQEDHSFVANRVVVHNCGGMWEEGMAIYDSIKSCPFPVTILNYTHARSMSSIIFQAANKRVMMPHSTFMLHDGSLGIEGTVKQVQSAVEFGKVADQQMMKIYVDTMKHQGKFSKRSKKSIHEWLRSQMDKKEDVYLTAKEAVEYGFADEIFNYNWAKLIDYTDEEMSRG